MSRKQGRANRDGAVSRREERGHDKPRSGAHGPPHSAATQNKNSPQSGRRPGPHPAGSASTRKDDRADAAATQPAKGVQRAKGSKPAKKKSAARAIEIAADGIRSGPENETRKLTDLVPSPWQAQFYDDLPEHERKALVADLKKNGLRQPIEILPENVAGLPPNTILDGCQRLAGLQSIGETEARVLVRYDLAGADRLTVEREFLAPNKLRRQLDPLAKARVAKRLWELARGPRRGGLSSYEAGDLRDQIGKEIGMSGRTLSRYFNVLQTPIEVQNALRNRKIKLVVAEKVAFLDKAAQGAIARRIRAGEDVKAVVSELVAAPERRVAPAAALNRLVREIERAHAVLIDQVDQVWIEPDAQDAVREGRRLLEKLEARAKRQGSIRAKSNAKLAKMLKSMGA